MTQRPMGPVEGMSHAWAPSQAVMEGEPGAALGGGIHDGQWQCLRQPLLPRVFIFSLIFVVNF